MRDLQGWEVFAGLMDPEEPLRAAAVVAVPAVVWAVYCLEYGWHSDFASPQVLEELLVDQDVYRLYLEILYLALEGQMYYQHLDVLGEDFVSAAHDSMKVPKVPVYPW